MAVTTVAAARRGSVSLDQCFQRVGRQERDITRQEDQHAACSGQGVGGRHQGVRRPELWLLNHNSETRPSGQGLSQDFGLMPNNNRR